MTREAKGGLKRISSRFKRYQDRCEQGGITIFLDQTGDMAELGRMNIMFIQVNRITNTRLALSTVAARQAFFTC